MSRTDVPTLMCDRCEIKTQSLSQMGSYAKLSRDQMGGPKCWDLCPTCWSEFMHFMEGASE